MKKRETVASVALILANVFCVVMAALRATMTPVQRAAFDGWSSIAIIAVVLVALALATWAIVIPKRRAK